MHLRIHEEFSDIEKIIYIIEKMSLSEGVNKSQKRSGHLL
jgi:hypothetical protein